jgi:hypothetical protein
LRFSDRVPWAQGTNDLTRHLEARRARGLPVLDLTLTNPTRAGLGDDGEVVLRAISREEGLKYDPDPLGLPAAREAVADYYREQGVRVSAGSIVLTASTSEAYSLLFKLLCNPGDAILVPRPSYPLFEHLAALDSVETRSYPSRYTSSLGWRLDLEGLRAGFDDHTRAVVVVHPQNPTGAYSRPEELDEMAALCAEHDAALIADEVFFDFPSPLRPVTRRRAGTLERGLTFSLSGLSKIVALPQLKLGWIVIGGPEPAAREARDRLEFIADTYLSVSAGVQVGARELLDLRGPIQSRIRARLEHNERVVEEICRPAGALRHRPREGGWYCVLELPPRASDEVVAGNLLDTEGVLVHPGYYYDFEEEHLLVASLITPEETFREGLERLARRAALEA